MALTIYNSLTKEKEIVKPVDAGKIRLYVCGMTVYDYCHIGHARVLVVFDTVVRYLRKIGYDVYYARNITDIDDKIIQRANENKEDYSALTKRFIAAMHEDENALNILPPDHSPRATDYIPQMIAAIQTLIEKGYAYTTQDGDVYYDVSQFKTYGALSRQDLAKLRAGARVATVDAKQDPLDFVLWKLAKPGEPSWDSPWGKGRPGWHIECSVMSIACLGEHFDIHGGGFDLTFPHHENEIAQAEAITGKPFVNLWMHAGFLQINKEKMSKSLSNFLTIREVLSSFSSEAVRYFLMSGHYRSPLNYSTEALESAAAAVERFYLALRGLASEKPEMNTDFERQFHEAMMDDFNTPDALAVLFDLTRAINRAKLHDVAQASRLGALLRQLAGCLGILQEDPEAFLQKSSVTNETIDTLIAARNEARSNKNWEGADHIRQQLLAMGITLEDTSAGTLWRRENV